MKKVLLVALVSCLSAQVEGATSSSDVNFYAGISAVGSWTSSDFRMDYDVNKDQNKFPKAISHAYHKDNSIDRAGLGLHAGIKKKFKNDLFVSGELGYTFSRAKHHHDFTEAEDQEADDQYPDETISYINVKHGNELALALKFGKDCNSSDVYGIVGVTTKDVKIEYSLDDGNPQVKDKFDVSTKDRAWGAVFGLGGSKRINDNVSCSLEYRYKLYGSAKKDIDCMAESKDAFGGVVEHDTSDRHFKVKSGKHELSLGITFNI